MIARSRPRTADIRRDRRPELQEPPPDRLVGCVNTSLGQQFLDIPKGQREPGIEPDRVADDFWREAVALERYRSHPMILIRDEPQSYPSYRDIAQSLLWVKSRHPARDRVCPLSATSGRSPPRLHCSRGELGVEPSVVEIGPACSLRIRSEGLGRRRTQDLGIDSGIEIVSNPASPSMRFSTSNS